MFLLPTVQIWLPILVKCVYKKKTCRKNLLRKDQLGKVPFLMVQVPFLRDQNALFRLGPPCPFFVPAPLYVARQVIRTFNSYHWEWTREEFRLIRNCKAVRRKKCKTQTPLFIIPSDISSHTDYFTVFVSIVCLYSWLFVLHRSYNLVTSV